jgi:hypothetical protein
MIAWDPKFKMPPVGRELLQPEVLPEQLDTAPQCSMEQVILDAYGNVVRLWADSHKEIPGGRLEGKFKVVSASRQTVALLSVQTQVIRRRIEQRQEPASRSTPDARPLPSGTPLSVVPLEGVDFPSEPKSATHRLPGGEEIHPCERCGASGHLACAPCGQTGRVPCGTCGGSKRLRCGSCNGAGLVRLANGVIVNCTACLTQGFRVCSICGADGHVTCSTCSGEGFLTCSPCGGYGRICTFHVVISETSTTIDTVPHYAEEWGADVLGLAASMPLIWNDDVPLMIPTSGASATFSVDGYGPPLAPGMLGKVRDAITGAVDRGSVKQRQAETARAVRFQVHGCYLHRVGYKLDGGASEERLFIGGIDNRVAPGLLLERCRTSTAWLQRGVYGIGRFIGFVEDTGPSASFKKRLKKGDHVHSLDSRGVVADAVEKAGLVIVVLDIGYSLLAGGVPAGVIEFTHEEAGNLIVSFVVPIGPAIRERFVTALQINQLFSFGRIALTTDPDSGALEFKLYDVRLYDDIDEATYRLVASYMINTAGPNAAAKLLR